ncbi:MAG: type II toxin-antitoxin system VapC family toxin [Aigarchaeota archaeon]|nr:type II toxin-antitoxin system VapC family toxin [Candidatus Pelearchaeum maunauluense]
MSYLLDASGLLNLLRRLGEDIIDAVKNQNTTDIILHEAGNAFWKEYSHGRMELNEALRSLEFINLLLRQMHVIKIEGEWPLYVLENAVKLRITFYDSAYLTQLRNLDFYAGDG